VNGYFGLLTRLRFMLFSFDAVSLALASEVEYPGPELASATLASLRCTPGEPARLFRARDFKSWKYRW